MNGARRRERGQPGQEKNFLKEVSGPGELFRDATKKILEAKIPSIDNMLNRPELTPC